MADGVARVAGLGGVVELGGRSWIIHGRTVEFYALLEAEILKLRGDPFGMVVEAAAKYRNDPYVVNMIASSVAEKFRNWRFATYSDYSEFFRTPYGSAFQIWAAIRHNDPQLSVHQVQFWIMELIQKDGTKGLDKRDELLSAIDRASGDDALGNLTSSPQVETPVAGA